MSHHVSPAGSNHDAARSNSQLEKDGHPMALGEINQRKSMTVSLKNSGGHCTPNKSDVAFVHASTRQLSHPRADPVFAHHSRDDVSILIVDKYPAPSANIHVCSPFHIWVGWYPSCPRKKWTFLVGSDRGAQEEPQGSVYLTDPKPEPERRGSDWEPGMGGPCRPLLRRIP